VTKVASFVMSSVSVLSLRDRSMRCSAGSRSNSGENQEAENSASSFQSE